MTALTEKRAKDRAIMATRLTALAESMGATVERRDGTVGGYPGPREIQLKIKVPGGAYLPVDFDADSCQVDVHVCTWNVETDSDACFADAFGYDAVNRHHFRKAGWYVVGFDALCERIRADLQTFNDGRGYHPARTVAHAETQIASLEKGITYYAEFVAQGRGTKWQDGTEYETPAQVRDKVEREFPAAIERHRAVIAAAGVIA